MRARRYSPIISSAALASLLADPKFIPRIWPGRGNEQDWATTTMAAIAGCGGIARTGQVAQMLQQRPEIPPPVLTRLRNAGLVTLTKVQWTGAGAERWIALDDRHPFMPELRDVLTVLARRLPPPKADDRVRAAPSPPYQDAAEADLTAFFGDRTRTRLLAIIAKVAPIMMTDIARYAAVAEIQGRLTVNRLAVSGLVTIHRSADDRRRVWLTLNRDAYYGEPMRRLVLKVASFQQIPFAGFKKVNDAKIKRLITDGRGSAALLDRLKKREALLDT